MSLVRPLARPLVRALPHSLIKGGGDIITSIFADGTDGFYFDFSKTDRLFQNLTNTPADDAGENIYLGLESHAWSGRTLGQQIAATTPALDDDFSSSSGWTLQTDLAVTGGKLTCTAAASTRGCYKAVSLSAGWHRVQFDLDSVSGGNVAVELCNDANGTNGTGVTSNASSGTKVQYMLVTNQTGVRFRFQSGTTAQVDNLRIDRVAGNHGLQATTSAQPKWQTGGLARFDGSDDNLLTTLVPSTSMTLMAKAKVTSSGAFKIGIGSSDGTNRCWLGLSDTNVAACRLGSGTTVTGAVGLAGSTVVLGATSDGATVTLYVNGVSVGTQAFAGAAPAVALAVGGINTSGTLSLFAPEDAYDKLAIKKALTADQIAAITNKWGTS